MNALAVNRRQRQMGQARGVMSRLAPAVDDVQGRAGSPGAGFFISDNTGPAFAGRAFFSSNTRGISPSRRRSVAAPRRPVATIPLGYAGSLDELSLLRIHHLAGAYSGCRPLPLDVAHQIARQSADVRHLVSSRHQVRPFEDEHEPRGLSRAQNPFVSGAKSV